MACTPSKKFFDTKLKTISSSIEDNMDLAIDFSRWKCPMQPPFSDSFTSQLHEHGEWMQLSSFLSIICYVCPGSELSPTVQGLSLMIYLRTKWDPVQQKLQEPPWYRSELSFIAKHCFNQGSTANESFMFLLFLCLCIAIVKNPILLFQDPLYLSINLFLSLVD